MENRKHCWSYEENEYCVDEIFRSFVIGKEYDYNSVVTKLYVHFDGKIKRSSIKMKLQNIKYLFNKFNVPNTLAVTELENVAQDNVYAFFAVAKKYNKLFNG